MSLFAAPYVIAGSVSLFLGYKTYNSYYNQPFEYIEIEGFEEKKTEKSQEDDTISNINEPSNILNYLSQGNIPSGAYSLTRFFVNSTIGLFGLFDVAGNIGLQKNATDFGKTLEKWGIGEGQFLVVPFLGPRTSRHFFGTIVDIALNPVRYVLKDEDTIVSFSPSIIYALSERSRNGDTIDNLRETSIDYYSTLRSIYLQNREINIVDNFEEDQDIFESDLDEFYESEDDKK